MARVRVDGKQFCVADERFHFRGVTYGTFRPREDGHRFPERNRIKRDFEAMGEASFSVVRTYTAPSDDLLDLAADWELRVLAGVYWPDWRYLVGASRRAVRAVARDARREVGRAARRLAGSEQVLGIVLGNEVPADVVRWIGTETISSLLEELCDVVRVEDPETLVTYANYPTAEYLPLEGLDFLTFNVFLEDREDLRAYLARLHTLAGDRPLVLGEIGLDAGTTSDSERRQAEVLDEQLEAAMERGAAGSCVFSWTDEWWVGDSAVEGWQFGLTRSDRSPRPALQAVARRNRTSVADLRPTWESVSVVICAYDAEDTLAECLHHTCRLDYPNLEIIVVDDGSTDATAQIARRYPRARLISIEHAGLSVARNEGLRAATGQLVAYLDSDAYPSPEWPYYLVLGLDRRTVGGVGGPNIPPLDDSLGAQVVARSPGGPIHVLLSDDRAEHVPGCNMAFWRHVLEEVGGFDPVYTAAGDDVDICWKILDRRWEIAFHPAALVWHHRRPGLRRYLRQQRGYGRAEALVEVRHPDRFNAVGTAKWRGRIYNSLVPSWGRVRIYRGLYGAAAYQSIYRAGGHGIDLAHQVGIPVAFALVLTAPLAALHPALGLGAAVALVWLLGLAVVDVVGARPPRTLRRGCLRFRASVAVHHLLQPLVRTWGRRRAWALARRHLPAVAPLPRQAAMAPGGAVLLPEDRPRAELAAAIVGAARHEGFRVMAPTGWEAHDARLLLSTFVAGDLLTSSHPPGTIQVSVRPALRVARTTAAVLALAVLAGLAPSAAALGLLGLGADLARGWWRARRRLPRLLQKGAPS
ncbi:MAG TPA: glycosyltransferase [Acidimicrobiales bacterium]|nr:glycosyltransferase [Acidimicrobiales bacterium]